MGKFELSVSFRCAWTSFLIFPNFSGLHSDQNMMKPQIKNSHKFVGIPLSWSFIIFWSGCRTHRCHQVPTLLLMETHEMSKSLEYMSYGPFTLKTVNILYNPIWPQNDLLGMTYSEWLTRNRPNVFYKRVAEVLRKS